MEAAETAPLERRTLGSTGESLSVIGFGGVIVTNTTTEEAANYVAEAFDRGVNYFDVAPAYGNAQEMLGPALKPYRDRSFLACKTRARDKKGVETDLNDSLALLQTDRFDLYQFHALIDVKDDVEALLAPGGGMEAALQAKEAGKIRYIGFSAHTEEAALAAMERFEFDSILFPFNYFTWSKGHFGARVLEAARARGMGVLALKSMARQKWPHDIKFLDDRPWKKCWYQPMDDIEKVELLLRFTLHLPVDALITPGEWELFKMALDLAQAGKLTPLGENELEPLDAMQDHVRVLFEGHVA